MLTEEEKSGPQLVLDVCDALAQSVKALKEELKKIYVDTELPLAERWYFFTMVPNELQDTYDWIMHFNEFENKYGAIEWYDKYVYDRHATSSLVDLVEEQIMSYLEEDDEAGVKPFTKANLDEFKEAILTKGYHSFVFDW